MPLQGLCTFPGVQQVLAANMTFGHGIAPSMATLHVAPQDNFVPQIGPLTFIYGSTAITFQDCKVDRFSFDRDSSGRRRWAIYLLDRRWRWLPMSGGGTISGYYNTRRNDNQIVEETQQDARALAELLLEALGESRYDVTALAKDVFPVVEWDYAHPAEELARLCESLGCRVTLGLDDQVRVVKLGAGNSLPGSDDVLSDSLSIDIPEMPDELICVAAKTRYQKDFELEAVAMDTGGDLVPLLEASYNPEKGKSVARLGADLPNFLNVVNSNVREMAKASAFRWYRIKEPFTLAGVNESKLTRDRILPIEAEQIDTYTSDESERNLAAWVFGIYYADRDDMLNSVEKIDPASLAKGSPALYVGGFEIDRDLGIVKFDQPVFQQIQQKAAGTATASATKVNAIAAATLYLRTAVSLRDKDTRGWMHRERKSATGVSLGTMPRYIVQNGVGLNVDSDGKDNGRDVDEVLDFYLDAAMNDYQLTDPRSISYAGLKVIDLDGAIRQVTWSVGEDGRARTRASRNREELDVDVSYADRRLYQRLAASVAEQDRRAASTPADRAKAGPPPGSEGAVGGGF